MRSSKLIRILALAPLCLVGHNAFAVSCADAGNTPAFQSPGDTATPCDFDATNVALTTIDFKNNGDTVNIKAGVTGLTTVIASADGDGIVNVDSDYTQAGAWGVSGANALNEINLNAATLTQNNNLIADTVTLKSASSVLNVAVDSVELGDAGSQVSVDAGILNIGANTVKFGNDLNTTATGVVNVNGTGLNIVNDLKTAGTTSTVNVNSTGATVGNDLLVNGTSTVDVNLNTLNVTNDLTPEAGKAANLNISIEDTAGKSGKFVVGNNVALDALTNLNVTVMPGAVIQDSKTITVITGTGAHLQAPVVTSSSALLSFTPDLTTVGQLDLVTSRSTIASQQLANPVFRPVAMGFDAATTDPNATADMGLVVSEFDTLTLPQMEEALATTAPDLGGDNLAVSKVAQNSAFDTVLSRTQELRLGQFDEYSKSYAAGDNGSYWGVWLKPFYTYFDQDDADGVDGYDSSVYGASIGIDMTWENAYRFGLAYTFASSTSEGNGFKTGSETDSTFHIGTLYGSCDHEYVLVDAMLSYGYGDYDHDRVSTVGTIVRRHKAEYNGHQFSAKVKAGVPLRYTLDVVPFAGLTYHYTDLDGYTETGGGALDLVVGDEDYSAFIGTLGVQVGKFLDRANRGRGEIHAAVSYDFIDDEISRTATFSGSSVSTFTATGFKNDEFTGLIGGMLAWSFNKQTHFSARYDFGFSENTAQHTGSAEIRYEFG